MKRSELTWPLVFVVLSVMPALGGLARLHSLSVPETVDNARFIAAPLPVIVHIVTATLYAMLGAFQFSAGLRRRWPAWHRRAGVVLTLCGLVTGLTGMWMAVGLDIPQRMQGPILMGVRLVVGAVTVAALVLAWVSIVRRDIPAHEAWMIRAYALAQGAATQALLLGPWILISGELVGVPRDLMMTLTWVINAGIAEALIHRRDSATRARGRALRLSRA
jgi:uncharacterized membrane protein YozB (DUF420 family)